MDVGDRPDEQASIDEAYRDLLALARALTGRHAGQDPPNALVHEAWLRMEKPLPPYEDHREELLTAASRVMRQVLVEELRSTKRTEEALHLGAASSAVAEDHQIDAEDLEDALKRLHRLDCRLARTVKLRFFSGLSNAEIGHRLGVSAKTVQRDWAVARAWLRRDLIGGR